jgi:hypothetical protein
MFQRMRELLRTLTRREVADYARQAQEWLDDPVFDRVIAEMRQAAETTWLSSRDPETRERVWYEMHRINTFVRRLKVLVENDKLETSNEARAAKSRRAPLA